VAACDIDASEQLNISYIDGTMNFTARQQKLEWSYGFRCNCALCEEEQQQS